MSKIRRILTTDARAERVVALSQFVRSDCAGEANSARLALPPVANQNQKFPYQSIFGGGCGGSRLKNERKFYGFVSAASFLQKGLVYVF